MTAVEREPPGSIIQALEQAQEADRWAASELLPLVYAELHRLARSRMARTPPGNTLQATALVHEAYLRLVGNADPGWQGRGHFFAAAAQAMRQILVEQVRRKGRLRHGGDRRRVELSESVWISEPPGVDLLALDEVLRDLEKADERKARIVMLRYFAGLTIKETAEVLGVSVPTIEREWRFIRALLYAQLHESDAGGEAGQ